MNERELLKKSARCAFEKAEAKDIKHLVEQMNTIGTLFANIYNELENLLKDRIHIVDDIRNNPDEHKRIQALLKTAYIGYIEKRINNLYREIIAPLILNSILISWIHSLIICKNK